VPKISFILNHLILNFIELKVVMKPSGQKTETTRQLIHSMLELRDELRQFMQKKFKENNIDLTYEMHQVMSCLWKRDGINQQEIANLTLKDKAGITFLIDNLSKRDLVKRQEDPNDRRSKLIYLTSKGKRLGQKIEPWLNELFTIAGGDVETSTMQTYIKTIEKMRDNVKGQ
jgi:DNA-binding MarR family transcriptional regulator